MKKVLIITYYWPPAGGPGIQRVLKMVRHLPAQGWQPVILTVADGDYPAIDEGLVARIPDNCPVYRTPILEPYHLYRKLTGKARGEKLPTYILNPHKDDSLKDKLAKWVRAKLFIPDARIGWIPYAVKGGKRAIREENIDLIFSTSPPHTVQLIAKKLAAKSGLPWVADFRDPWSEAFWVAELQQEGLVKKINLALEKSVLRRADAVVTVSAGIADLLKAKAPNRYEIIQNGFETIEAGQEKTERFMILFFGHLNKYQNWESLFRALRRLPEALRSRIDIVFVGKVFEGFRAAFETYHDLNIQQKPYMAYREMMAFARRAALLFRPLSSMSYAASGIGAKTYDYLALRKPVLAIGPRPSVMQQVLEETGSGEIFRAEAVEQIAQFIERHFRQWERPGFLSLADDARLDPYRTAHNVAQLAGLFDELLAQKGGGGAR